MPSTTDREEPAVMRTVKKSDVTYGQLERTLRGLGFEVFTGKNMLGAPYIGFEDKENDAVILVRWGEKEESLNAIDLLSATRTLEGRGVMNGETFHRLLREAAQKERQAA